MTRAYPMLNSALAGCAAHSPAKRQIVRSSSDVGREQASRQGRRLAPWILSALFALFPVHAAGQVTHIEINSRIDLLNGRPFGLAGAYEKLAGTGQVQGVVATLLSG